MAETHEPSYYEIALTNRQVIVAFVILLVCVAGAFFSGVWIGREATARAAQDQIVRNTPPPQGPQDGKNLDELEFFAKNKKGGDAKKTADAPETTEPRAVTAPSVSPPAPPAANGGTLADDLAGRRPTVRKAPMPTPAPAEEAAAEPPAPAPRRAQPAPEPAAPTADPAPAAAAARKGKNRDKAAAAKAPAKASRAATAAAGNTTASAKGAYVIQVFSSADKTQADHIRAKLVGGGQKAFLSPIDRGGRTMYRVRLGPFKSRGDAQAVADKVRKGYRLDTWVTE